MAEKAAYMGMITDYVTGHDVPDIGAEANRQAVERFLVDDRGYRRRDIRVDTPVELTIGGAPYRSKIDLMIWVDGEDKAAVMIKCAAGSLGSREREVVSAARILLGYQVPIAVAADGVSAVVLDTVSGKRIGSGMSAIPSKSELMGRLSILRFHPYPEDRVEREKLIYRSYDIMNIHSRA
ncbi:MAG: type I restriction enzyme HsdR N-terminal domain-containing protein [Desulfobacterales bacterium]|jgi:hypothetical protein